MTFKTWMMPLSTVSLLSACPVMQNDALFRDVSQRPPNAQPATIEAISQDRPFAEWVLYQDRACDEFGCAE